MKAYIHNGYLISLCLIVFVELQCNIHFFLELVLAQYQPAIRQILASLIHLPQLLNSMNINSSLSKMNIVLITTHVGESLELVQLTRHRNFVNSDKH